jgi:acetyl-CoA synthetase
MNFTRDLVCDSARALVEIRRDGSRREWTFAEIAAAAEGMAGALHARGVRRGDVVMTLIGNRPEWAITMLACFRQGYVVLPCIEQLRPKDLALRLDVARPRVVVADPRNAGVPAETMWVETAPAPPPAELAPEDPCLITFTSGTAGEPKAVLHGQRYLTGQRLQAEHWLAPQPGDLVWCTAAAGWSKSARNAFIAPWLRGAAALLHDARFDPHERLELIARERVDVLCMAPTEYRVIAKRATIAKLPLKGLVAAGEALNPEVLHAWHDATGLWSRDGYGQTETGQLTGAAPRETPRPGSMGRPLPGVDLRIIDGELVLNDPKTDPTFFLRYLGEDPHEGPWRTGDRVTLQDGYLYFEGRTDDASSEPSARTSGAVSGATTVTSSPRLRSDAATSSPMKLAPSTTARRACFAAAMMRRESPSERR